MCVSKCIRGRVGVRVFCRVVSSSLCRRCVVVVVSPGKQPMMRARTILSLQCSR